MKYVSIDIETGGLHFDQHSLIEVAAVIEDTDKSRISDVMKLPSFRMLCYQNCYSVTPFCAKLHVKLFEEIERRKSEVLCPLRDPVEKFFKEAQYGWHGDFLCHTSHAGSMMAVWLEKNGFARGEEVVLSDEGTPITNRRIKINVAGKNFSNFDKSFLYSRTDIVGFIDIRHRVIDIASHFWQPGDECLPDTNTCLKRAGLNIETDHTALSDARNVVRLVRKALLEPYDMVH